jgi:transcriptional regulator with XRE-family HTH domain
VKGVRFVLGANVRKARKARGMTQLQLAVKTGFVVSTISDLERGVTDPQVSIVQRIAEALDVPIGELLGESEPAREVASTRP